MALRILVCAVMGYLLGTLNGAIVISKLLHHEDVRTKGSGNAGMTNFLRSYGGASTLLVILIDAGKMVAACFLAEAICPQEAAVAKMVAGTAVQLGHIFPVFFGLHGGKGILCSGALAVVMDWRIFAVAFSLFLLIFLLTRYVSLGSVAAAAAYCVMFVVCFPSQPIVQGLGVFMGALAILMHRGNIKRLLKGEERKTHLHKSKNKE